MWCFLFNLVSNAHSPISACSGSWRRWWSSRTSPQSGRSWMTRCLTPPGRWGCPEMEGTWLECAKYLALGSVTKTMLVTIQLMTRRVEVKYELTWHRLFTTQCFQAYENTTAAYLTIRHSETNQRQIVLSCDQSSLTCDTKILRHSRFSHAQTTDNERWDPCAWEVME